MSNCGYSNTKKRRQLCVCETFSPLGSDRHGVFLRPTCWLGDHELVFPKPLWPELREAIDVGGEVQGIVKFNACSIIAVDPQSRSPARCDRSRIPCRLMNSLSIDISNSVYRPCQGTQLASPNDYAVVIENSYTIDMQG